MEHRGKENVKKDIIRSTNKCDTDGKLESIISTSIYGVSCCAMNIQGTITILRNICQVFRRTEPWYIQCVLKGSISSSNRNGKNLGEYDKTSILLLSSLNHVW